MRKLMPLLLEEQQANDGHFTHLAIIDADDLTMVTANTVQDIPLGTVPKGWIIGKTMVRLIVPFQNTGDGAYNTSTLIIGDSGSSNRYLTSTELNKNGSYVTIPKYNNTSYQVTGDTAIVAEFGSQSSKSLSSLNKGEVHIFLQLIDTGVLSDLQGTAPITTK